MSSFKEELANMKKVPRVSDKEITIKRYRILEKRIEDIKEACSRLKNSSTSKNDALREIKNICNTKDDEKKIWKEILGDSLEEV